MQEASIQSGLASRRSEFSPDGIAPIEPGPTAESQGFAWRRSWQHGIGTEARQARVTPGRSELLSGRHGLGRADCHAHGRHARQLRCCPGGVPGRAPEIPSCLGKAEVSSTAGANRIRRRTRRYSQGFLERPGVVAMGGFGEPILRYDLGHYVIEFTVEGKAIGATATLGADVGSQFGACGVVVRKDESGPGLLIRVVDEEAAAGSKPEIALDALRPSVEACPLAVRLRNPAFTTLWQ